MGEERVACRTPTEGRNGATNIPKWKFDLLRDHILAAIGTGDVRFSALPGLVKARLTAAEIERMGSVGWHVTSVKLELEVRGEIERIAGVSPQRLRRAG